MPEVDRSTQPQQRRRSNAGNSDRCRNIILAWIPICVVITILFIFATHLWAALITFVILLFMISFSLYYYYAVMPHDITTGLVEERCATGLSPSIVKENPVFVYQRDGGEPNECCNGCDKAGLRCAVCIGTVHDGDLVRQLLMCKHVFHTDCIDSWLPSHSTCPMCRTDVKTGKLASEQPAPPV